jgi:hypothetical protein
LERKKEMSLTQANDTDIMILTAIGITEITGENIKILSSIYESELKFGKTNEKIKEILKSSFK